MRVQVVVENHVEHGRLLGEHGLCQFLQTPRGSILFDTGQGMALEHNLRMLGIAEEKVDMVVCSHGHFDHTWGILCLLRQGWNVPVYAHHSCTNPRFSLKKGRAHPIGFPLGENFFSPLQGNEELLPGVHALVVPREKRNEAFIPSTPSLVVPRGDNSWEEDPFSDDLSLVIRGRKGWSVLLGCAHSGVVNILEEAAEVAGTRDFYAVQGGMHFKGQTHDFVVRVLKELGERFRVQHWRPCHCAGTKAFLTMGKYFDSVTWAGGGSSLEL